MPKVPKRATNTPVRISLAITPEAKGMVYPSEIESKTDGI